MLVAIVSLSAATTPPFINPGTPPGIAPSFDCAARVSAWNYGKHLLPQRGDFRTLFEALELQACGLTTPATMDEWSPPTFTAAPGQHSVFADAVKGDDTHAGTLDAPVQTIAKAVALAAANTGPSTVLLRAGTYHVAQTVQVTSDDLTIQNYKGERAVVSGGVPLQLQGKWVPYNVTQGWEVFQDSNNVYGRAHSRADSGDIKYLGTFNKLQDCENALKSSTKGPFMSFTYHTIAFGGDYAGQCFGVTDDMWSPRQEKNIISGKFNNKNVWVTDVSGVSEITGLRLDGQRAIRAKYPNGNMELSGNWMQGAGASMGGGQYKKGWVTQSTQWVPPFRHPDSEDVVANDADWPSVEWPHYEGGQTGEGDQGDYHIGVGGYCQQDLLDPVVGPTGYWCAMHPPRGQCWDKKKNQGRGCTQTHMSPDGVVWERAKGYSDPTTAVINAWRGGGRWFTQMWKVSHFVEDNATLIFDPSTGGQGGEGMTNAGQWWIENVKEECDSANEFFFDEKESKLYFNFNGTKPTGKEDFVATRTRVLFNVTGTMAKPVRGFTLRGVVLRDTRLTYLDPHGMPSGGDWALQRSGAVFLQGTEKATVDSCLLTRLDGNGVLLSKYNRNATISNNEVSWNGDTAFAGWGITGECVNENCSRKLDWPVGPDGRGGEQPRFTSIVGNLVREIGIWQKQSSMWFQAVTAQTLVHGNVHFNGPRAGLNFNDGFGGGDEISNNLLLNCVRESGDHGPYNSWDRIPYITTIGTGKPSIIPAWRQIKHNFVMSLYSSQEAIDTDDGSAYYETFENFFVFAANGLKSDFNGHDNRHYRNVYGYVSNCWGGGNNNWFVNNTCVANSDSGGFRSDCRHNSGMRISGNSIYNRDGKLDGKLCDSSNTVHKVPSDQALIQMGEHVIGWK